MDFEDLYGDEPRDSNGSNSSSPAGQTSSSGQSGQVSSGSPEPKKIESPQESLAAAVSRAVLGLILLVSFVVGCWVAYTALLHPDACWFLAMGRWIYEHGAVPDLDPFSWVMTVDGVKGHPFVVDQWLSALISYLSTLAGGLLTLLMLNAVVIVTAFLSLPLGFVVRRGAPFVAGLVLVLLSMVTAFLCPTSCTQIFSYLFVAVFLQVVHHARSAMLWHDEKVFRVAYVLVPLMVLWANLHAGFVIGLLILAACLLGTQLSKLFLPARLLKAAVVSPLPDKDSEASVTTSRATAKSLTQELTIALGCSLLATFATPYGWNLWLSMPDSVVALLSSASAPLAHRSNVTSFSYYTFGLLCLSFVLFVVREISALKAVRNSLSLSNTDGLVISELVIAVFVGAGAIALSVVAPGLIVFTTLIVLAEILALLGLRRLAAHADAMQSENIVDSTKRRTFWQDLNFHSLDVWLAGGAFELAIVSFCSIAGVCLVANKVHKPELPASTLSSSTGPALQFIEQHKSELGERLFNDAAFGSQIDWRLRASPKVFIDTRYSGYERRIADDYQAIIDCSPRYQQLLDGWAIDTVFIAPNSKLAGVLLKDSAWKQVYRDHTAVILVRKMSYFLHKI
ncbi:hypothetical protein BH11CYA1_BH11CYA1_09630 [soil metagenome]